MALERVGREDSSEAGHRTTAGDAGSREAGGPGRFEMEGGRKRVKTLAPGLTDCSGR